MKDINTSIYIGADTIGRFSHTSHIIGKNKLLLVGGLSSQLQISKQSSGQSIAVFDLQTYAMAEYQIHSQPLLGLPLLFNHTSICDMESYLLYIFGGGNNCFSFGVHVNKSILTVPLKNIDLQYQYNELLGFY